jgi:putative redox protein
MAKGNEVVVSSCDGFRHEAWAGEHTLLIDEPAALGGSGAGPNPYELILAALGACTSMTLRLYAQRKEWPLEQVEVRLRHSRIHAQDCADCFQREGYLDHVEKEIVVGGLLTEEQVARLGEIAERCPVNVTLHASAHTTQTIRLATRPEA